MQTDFLYEAHQLFSGDDMNLIYSGDFSDDVTAQVIDLSGDQFSDAELNKLQRKTGFLIAECFQNIVRHNESSVENGYFLTKNKNGQLFIASGNVVASEFTTVLTEKLNHLNNLSQEELKEVYIKTLSNNTLSAKGGAGLGLIEMARKTGNKLDFNFSRINDQLSYFYFQIKLNTTKEDRENFNYTLSDTINLREKMLNNNIFLLYQGDVSMNTILPILNMVEKTVSSQTKELATLKIVYIALTEFLQNMSKYGSQINGKQEGLILLGEKNGKYFIGGYNYAGEKDKNQLESKLKKYVHLGKEELNAEYKRILKEGDSENKNGSSLGIIEMARRSSAPISYKIQPKENGQFLINMLLQI